MSRRDAYADVGRAMRAAIGRAIELDKPLSGREWRVLTAVFSLTASYSRIEERGTNAERIASMVAKIAGVEKLYVQKTLRRLDAAGVIAYDQARGPYADNGSVSLLPKRLDSTSIERGAIQPQSALVLTGRFGTAKEVESASPSLYEEVHEETTTPSRSSCLEDRDGLGEPATVNGVVITTPASVRHAIAAGVGA